jgi:hypothetical protein
MRAVTVVGVNDSQTAFKLNRYGLYQMSGNVVEWIQSLFRPFNREDPYTDDDRNHDDVAGLRVARGGSWYNASTAVTILAFASSPDASLSVPLSICESPTSVSHLLLGNPQDSVDFPA